jgi:hypothetical protein
VELCITRAGGSPFDLNGRFDRDHDQSIDPAAIRKILSQTQHALITLMGSVHMLRQPANFRDALEAPGPVLCSLTVYTRERWSLTSQFLGGQSSMLTKLHLENVHLEYTPDFSNLQSLSLNQFTTSLGPLWAVRLFGNMPQLKVLNMAATSDGPNLFPALVSSNPAVQSTTTLPCLTHLALAATPDVLCPILQVLDVPTKVLRLRSILNQHVSANMNPAYIAYILNILSYSSRFWRNAMGTNKLPPTSLIVRNPPQFFNALDCFEITNLSEQGYDQGPQMALNSYGGSITANNPLLPHVTRLIVLWSRKLSERSAAWPIISQLPNLERMRLHVRDPRSIIETAQTWVDRCAEQGCRIVQVDIIGESGHLMWNPKDGPLQDLYPV